MNLQLLIQTHKRKRTNAKTLMKCRFIISKSWTIFLSSDRKCTHRYKKCSCNSTILNKYPRLKGTIWNISNIGNVGGVNRCLQLASLKILQRNRNTLVYPGS
ncbi:hypothetical protein RCL_jg19775.t1 [Rhizophagus clarus]|uniref:Uncharacterized protein n=1 Tax=Rhizophagus clarus TaxID=94130 RepID=A0A8H3R2Z3_9GLOM|nr:hypothetical protein RCL_jg19775.t1 [Rhizophagus clarus]